MTESLEPESISNAFFPGFPISLLPGNVKRYLGFAASNGIGAVLIEGGNSFTVFSRQPFSRQPLAGDGYFKVLPFKLFERL